MKRICVLGSTGSIGSQALKIAERYPDLLKVVALAASTSIEKLAEQIRAYKPSIVSVNGHRQVDDLKAQLDDFQPLPEIVSGIEGLLQCSTYPDCDAVLNGLVGSVGLKPTLASLREYKEVLLANKESLVMAGELICDLLKTGHGSLIPVDSEHSAIWQCLYGSPCHPGLRRIILTASGGPFRDLPIRDFEKITLDQALSHPTWKMGPKITVDSATLFNKGLEIIEAHHLFGLKPEDIDVVIHPASIVHSFVEFMDGSLLAQLSYPTMEIPIQYALLGGNRLETTVNRLNPADIGKLEFFTPDLEKFPSLTLARDALKKGGTAPAVLNGANEAAVGMFLDGKISFTEITSLVESALIEHETLEATENAIFSADSWAREYVTRRTSDIN